jgi:phosphoglycerol transferase MdoB-like AlkP superfamily enzyme
MITTFDSLGILLGLFAWVALVVLGVTAYFRMKLMKRFKTRYRGWRAFHAVLASSFTVAAIWHAIALGRHTDLAMSLVFVGLAAAGLIKLARLYLPERPALFAKAPINAALAEGAK